MPCYDDRGTCSVVYKSDPEDQRHIDRLTRLLCTACKEIVEMGRKYKGIYPEDDELRQWYKRHQKIDRQRSRKKR